MADLAPTIETNVAQPKSATVDGNSASQHPLPQQIEADRYIKSIAAASSAKRGLNISKLSPPGSV
jgi:hypothetical protein